VHDRSSLFRLPAEGIVPATNPAPTLDPSFAVGREDRGEVSRFCRASLRAGVARLLARSAGGSLCAIVVTLVMIVEIVVIDPGHDPGGQGVGRQGRRGARKLAWDYTTSTLLSASIHPTSENGDSAKFRESPKGEVRRILSMRSSPIRSSKKLSIGLLLKRVCSIAGRGYGIGPKG
jgi:hypothetical protein